MVSSNTSTARRSTSRKSTPQEISATRVSSTTLTSSRSSETTPLNSSSIRSRDNAEHTIQMTTTAAVSNRVENIQPSNSADTQPVTEDHKEKIKAKSESKKVTIEINASVLLMHFIPGFLKSLVWKIRGVSRETRIASAAEAISNGGMKLYGAFFNKDVLALFDLKKHEKDRIDVAKACAALAPYKSKYNYEDYYRLGHNIQLFQISDEKERIAVLKIAASNDTQDVTKFIKNFEISDQNVLIELASSTAKKVPHNLVERINNFKIKDEKALLNILLSCREGAAYSIFNDPRNLGLNDEADIAALLKAAAPHISTEWRQSLVIEDGMKKACLLSEQARIDIAEIASKHYEDFSSTLPSYQIKDKAALARIAISVIESTEKGGWDFCANLDNYGITDPIALRELAFAAAGKASSKVFQILEKFKIDDQPTLIELARIVAQHNPSDLANNLYKLPFLGQALRIELAETMMKTDPAVVSKRMISMEIESVEERFRLAQLLAALPKSKVIENLAKFQLADEDNRIAVAKIAAVHNTENLCWSLAQVAIKDELVRADILKIAAKHNAYALYEHNPPLHIDDSKLKGEIALIAVSNNPKVVVKAIAKLGVEDLTQRAAIARLAFAAIPAFTTQNIGNFDLGDSNKIMDVVRPEIVKDLSLEKFTEFAGNKGLPLEGLIKELLQPVLKDMIDSRNQESKYENLQVLIQTIESFIDVETTIGQRFATLFGTEKEWEVLAPYQRLEKVVDCILDNTSIFDKSLKDYQKQIKAEELLPSALALTILNWNEADVGRYNSRSQASLALYSGYSDLPKASDLSSDSSRELWGTLLIAQTTIKQKPADVLPVSFSNLPLALKLITNATTLKGLGGELPTFPIALQDKDQIDTVNQKLEDSISKLFTSVMGLNALPKGSVPRLAEAWGGDLSPFCVLASRYSEKEEWSKELPVLREIANKVLDGTFRDWRYRKDDKQLSMLSEEQLSSWRKNPFQISLQRSGNTNERQEIALVRESVKNTFETNLLRNLPEHIAVKARDISLNSDEFSKLVNATDKDFIKQAKNITHAVAFLKYAIESGTDEELSLATKIVQNNKQALLKDLSSTTPNIAVQLGEDISTLAQLAKIRVNKPDQGYYTVSLITDDPKLLMMTGDLVKSASCQNYKTGSHIQTLPGYVIDGNIKLALTYVIKEQVVMQALKELGVNSIDECTISFDAPKQSVVFETKNGKSPATKITKNLGNALRREVLRLGVNSEGSATLLTERAYLQTHAIATLIEAHQTGLIKSFMQSAGLATVNSKVDFPASRNIFGGVYSDKCGGVKIGKYHLEWTL